MSVRQLATRTLRAGQTRAFVRRDINGGDRQLGDYPVLPFVSRQFNDPLNHWDKQDRREREETVRLTASYSPAVGFANAMTSLPSPSASAAQVHEQDEVLGPWAYDQDPYIGKWRALGTLTAVLAGIGIMSWLAAKYDAPSKKPTAQRVLPFNNLEVELGRVPAPQ